MMHTLNIGSTLQGGKYEIIQVLGRGGFGITYLARHKLLDDTFAIKEFFPEDYCNRDASTSSIQISSLTNQQLVDKLRMRFLSEARNIRKLQHPGIVKIHDIFEENDTAYFVMDYIDGYSLEDLIKSGGALREDIAIKYIQQACQAISHIHAKNMTHFDIKPANLMVRRSDGTLVLIDFGLSKQYNDRGHVHSTLIVGVSRGFSPPEQYLQEGISEFSPQTDVYALGATLYYLVVGDYPPESISFAIKPLEIPETVSAPLAAVLLKAMNPQKEARYQSAAEFHDALQLALEGGNANQQSTTTHNTSVPPPPPVNTGNGNFGNGGNGNGYNSYPSVEPSDDPSSGRKKKNATIAWVIGGIVAGFLIVFGIMALIGKSGNSVSDGDSIIEDSAIVEEVVVEVEGLEWNSPLGKGLYSGEYSFDSAGNKVPDGKGELRITSGKFKGAVYNGQFVNGVMEGETVYTTADGDRFEGTFKNNLYDKGRYTSKSTGEYFEGTFANGEPDKGNWYSKSGELLE